LIRRGCVGLAREVATDQFVFDRPLHRPGLYDDIEVPNLFYLDGRYFLLGSIREDTKVHYWYSDKLDGPYENFFDNVLLPRGNYAARVCKHGDDWLLFNFFAKNENHNGRDISKKLLPPPKLLCTTPSGRLRMKSYPGFDDLAEACAVPDRADRFAPLFGNPHAAIEDRNAHGLHLSCASGYEAFLLPDEHESFRLRVKLDMEGQGKCGLVLRVDEQGDGYYLSLDLVKGVAQLRAWGTSPQPELEHAFRYHQLQAGYFLTDDQTPWQIEVVAHGMYLELSINGYVILSLVDDNYSSGRLGFYAESARLMLHDLTLETLARPVSEHDADMVYTGDCPDD
ncbi:MAG: glycosyl hydrolase, partial [Planctomycetota bacterium]